MYKVMRFLAQAWGDQRSGVILKLALVAVITLACTGMMLLSSSKERVEPATNVQYVLSDPVAQPSVLPTITPDPEPSSTVSAAPKQVTKDKDVVKPKAVKKVVPQPSKTVKPSTAKTTKTKATSTPKPKETATKVTPAKEPVQVSLYKNCTEAWNAGAAPVYLGDPGYAKKLDRDGDGVGCEYKPSTANK